MICAGLGRNEWTVTIHFPDASESLARSSVVKVTGTRDEAIATAQKRIEGWLTRQQRKARAGSIVDSRRCGGDRGPPSLLDACYNISATVLREQQSS